MQLKEKSQSKQMVITMFFSLLPVVVSYLISFTLTSYITESIGVDAYGFVSLAKNIITYVTILTTAINAYAVRFVSVEYLKNDIKKANMYFNTILFANIGISIMIFLGILIIIPNLTNYINIPFELITDVKILFTLVFINFILQLNGTAYSISAYIKNRLDIIGLFNTISLIVEAVVLIGLFYFFDSKIWYVGIASICMSTVILVSNIILTHILTKDLEINIQSFSIKSVSKIVGTGIWNSINQLGNVLNSGLDLYITNQMLTTLEMGQLSIAKTMAAVTSRVFQVVNSPFQPLFLKAYSSHNSEELLRLLKKAMRFSGLVANIIFSGFLTLGLVFYSLWIPSQDIELIYILTVLTMLTYIFEASVTPLYYIYTLTLKNRIPCIITLLGGILNVIGMYVLIQYTSLGIYSVVLTTTFIMTFINFVTNPIYSAKCLGLKWYTFYPEIFKNLLACVLVCTSMYIFTKIIQPVSWGQFILCACICSFIGVVINLLVIFDINEIKNWMSKIIFKKKIEFVK